MIGQPAVRTRPTTDARTPSAGTSAREQMRARYPDETGFVERPDGMQVFWERYGSGDPAILFVPTWSIVHSRIWKAQIPHFARRHRVITFDAVGNGRSSRSTDPDVYDERRLADDIIRVLDATGTEQAILVALSLGAQRSLIAAADHPDRVLGLALLGPSTRFGERLAGRDHSFEEPLPTDEGWAKENIHSWRRDYRGYLEFFFGQCFTEPHSTKQIEDAVGWGLETDPESLAATIRRPGLTLEESREVVAAVRCPVVVIQGDADAVTGPSRGLGLAEAMPHARLELIEGGGHINDARDPVRVNLLIEELVAQVAPPAGGRHSWTRGRARGLRRVLYISSPIGLGHAQRDAAIAAELRTIRPDIEIDWLAQHPVTAVLAERGERLHPLSAELASESAHIAAESSDHDLNAFQAIRRMDEILVANFMVFRDAVRDGAYDLVIGDEAWDVDYYLHENPELKRTSFAWLTDFVGWLPMPAGGEREAFVAADYNAEMIEQVERFPRIRDRAIFVGEPDDIVPDAFGPGLPSIRDWTERHYDFSGYVTGFDPRPLVEGREELRRELGFRPDERVVVVTVGGSGVGEALLRKVAASFPAASRAVNGLRMILVAGPRIEPASLGAPAGVEVLGFVPDLYRHLAASDLAIVQGGLTTTMELTAARRPFLYFPLRNHFEQNRHVRHRLERYRAGRCMDYQTADPDTIARAIADEIDRPVRSVPVESDGAARAARLIADLL